MTQFEYPLSIGMTVWVKLGDTKLSKFANDFSDEILEFVGKLCVILDIDEDDPVCTIQLHDSNSSRDFWFPLDWISLTPHDTTTSEEVQSKNVKYIAVVDPDVSYVEDSIDECVEAMKADGCDVEFFVETRKVRFYKAEEIEVEYVPASFKIR